MPRNPRLRIRHRIAAWRAAVKAVRKHGNNFEAAAEEVENELRVRFAIEVTIILFLIRLAVQIILWLIENDYLDPPDRPMLGAPGFRSQQDFIGIDDAEDLRGTDIDPRKELDFESKRAALWGNPRRPPVKEAWRQADYAPRGKFGPREAASVGENFVTAQAFMIPASVAIETLADTALPSASRGAFFTAAYGIQAIAYLTLKVVASVIRHRGESMLRNLFAWVYEQLMDFIGGIWPFSREKRKERRKNRREKRRDGRRKRRRSFLDWLNPFN